MIPRTLRIVVPAVLLAVVCGNTPRVAYSQTIQAKLDRGFARTSSIVASVQEMLGTQLDRKDDEPILGPGFPALWMAEIQYKPVRLLRMPVTDPATGNTSPELVWYMIYRVIPRDYTDLAGSPEAKAKLLKRLRDEAVAPRNDADAIRADSLLMPRFVLQTTDEGAQHQYVDEINHQIQRAVFEREFRREAADLKLLNSVAAISAVGAQVAADDPEALSHALYGVAIWRNVDAETDFFRVVMSGFTNAYRLTATEDGKIQVEDRCIVQEFGRPGDRFAQSEREFRVEGEPKWVYKVRDAQFDIPDALSILGNRSPDTSVK
jgi:hypothetical protein